MQESTPIEMTRSSGPCPTDEELAAYIDGGLGPAESERVTEHLASCEDCYDLYMETARFLVDPSGMPRAAMPVAAMPMAAMPMEALSMKEMPMDARHEGRVAAENVVRFPALAERTRSVSRWLSIAALLLVGAGGGTYFQLLKAPPALMPPALIGPLPNPAAQIPNFWKGPTFRGGPGEDETKLNDASFRMGVQAVNLQLSLKAGNGPEAEDGVARILGILKGQPFTDDLQKGYTGITLAVENHKAPADLLAEASRLAGLSRDIFDTTYLDLGQWVEAGRLAALARDPSFFQQGDSRAFLRRLRWNDRFGLHDIKLDPPTRESLRQIADVTSKGDLQASDYARLQQPFEEILKIHYPDT
jgi:hypothetical protein